MKIIKFLKKVKSLFDKFTAGKKTAFGVFIVLSPILCNWLGLEIPSSILTTIYDQFFQLISAYNELIGSAIIIYGYINKQK